MKTGWEVKLEQALLKKYYELNQIVSEKDATDSARKAVLRDQDVLMTESFLVENASCFETSMVTESSTEQPHPRNEQKDIDQSFTVDINFGAEMEEEEKKERTKWKSPEKSLTLRIDLDKMAQSITSINKSSENLLTERVENRHTREGLMDASNSSLEARTLLETSKLSDL